MDENFGFFALAYLNDWWQNDRFFVSGLLPSRDRNVRVSQLVEAATYYNIIRRFPKGSMPQVLDLVDATFEKMGPLATHNVDVAVTGLAQQLSGVSNRGVEISSASKFLWIWQQTPVVIFDSRAANCLVRLGSRLNGGYETYRAEWLKEFDKRGQIIQKACAELIRVKDFSPGDETDQQLIAVASSRWFHERVFDKLLWWNGKYK
jgi:hypothetical protein